MHAREAVEQNAQHVAQSRAAKRRYDSDAAREKRHRAFACAVEQAFGFEPALQLIERDLQRADAARLHFFGVKLQAAALLVNLHAAANDHFHAVDDFEAQPVERRLEHHGVDGAAGILEGEIEMIRGREARVRDLADDPALAESGVERVADPAHEVRNGNQARAMAAERKIELASHGRPTLSEQVAGHLYVALDELTARWGRH